MPLTATQAIDTAIETIREGLDSPKIVCQSEYTALHEHIESVLDSSRSDEDLAERVMLAAPGDHAMQLLADQLLRARVADSLQEMSRMVTGVGRDVAAAGTVRPFERPNLLERLEEIAAATERMRAELAGVVLYDDAGTLADGLEHDVEHISGVVGELLTMIDGR